MSDQPPRNGRRSDGHNPLRKLFFGARRLLYGIGKEPENKWHHRWRDLVPLLAIILAGWSVYGQEKASHDALKTSHKADANAGLARGLAAANREILLSISDTRRIAIRDACEADIAQDNVLRAILVASIRLRVRREGNTSDTKRARRLSKKLMAPLGGLDPPTEKQIDVRCGIRVRRGTP